MCTVTWTLRHQIRRHGSTHWYSRGRLLMIHLRLGANAWNWELICILSTSVTIWVYFQIFFSKDFAVLFLCTNRQKCCNILWGIGSTSEPQRLLHFIWPHISAVCLLVFDCQRISRLELSGPGRSTGKKKRLELSPLENTFSRSPQRWSKKECLRQMIFFF